MITGPDALPPPPVPKPNTPGAPPRPDANAEAKAAYINEGRRQAMAKALNTSGPPPQGPPKGGPRAART